MTLKGRKGTAFRPLSFDSMQLSFQPWTVSEIVAHLRSMLESDDALSDLWLQGEVSNFTRAASGHLYFTLKDHDAQLRCVMWRSAAARLPKLPRDGDAVYLHGHISIYEVRGELQLVCEDVLWIGAGLLYQRFEELKLRLDKEGLFAEERKRSLPRHPRALGVVTSREGAVLHDILHILHRRYPLVSVYLASTQVQGERAPELICQALEAIQRIADVELVILARGGGSLEDLWAFNDERVARAICACRVPVVTGVGHETDFTIADFCADLRAPTPTAAAQFCTPDQNELRANLLLYQRRMARCAHDALETAHDRLGHCTRDLSRNSPVVQIQRSRQRIDDLTRVAMSQLARQLELRRAQLHGRTQHLSALDPASTLARGYAIVQIEPDSEIVTHTGQVRAGDALRVRVSDGEFPATVRGRGEN